MVIDEIGTEAEAVAARTIAQRGVQLIGTAHGEPSLLLSNFADANDLHLVYIPFLTSQCKPTAALTTSPLVHADLEAARQSATNKYVRAAQCHLNSRGGMPTPCAAKGTTNGRVSAGNELANVLKNPSLQDLVGGIESVTLGDEEARRRGGQKSVLERAAAPTFDVAVEILERDRWRVHADVADAVDDLLRGRVSTPELAPGKSSKSHILTRNEVLWHC